LKKKALIIFFTVKDNQATLKSDIDDLNLQAALPQFETVDKGHGRIETRKIWCSDDLTGYIDFPHHKQVVRIEKFTTDLKGQNPRHEVKFCITSRDAQKATPEELLQIARSHWGIENSLHWVRDVTCDEDRSQIRTKSAPRVMATLRNLAVALLRLADHSNIAKAFRFYAVKPHMTLQLIGL
jgi:predicted transposase YbfD/YdcC